MSETHSTTPRSSHSSTHSSTHNSTDRFYDRIAIPLNYEFQENGLEFVNPVQVAEMFAEATTLGAQLAQQAEDVTGEIVNAEYQLTVVRKELTALRRRL